MLLLLIDIANGSNWHSPAKSFVCQLDMMPMAQSKPAHNLPGEMNGNAAKLETSKNAVAAENASLTTSTIPAPQHIHISLKHPQTKSWDILNFEIPSRPTILKYTVLISLTIALFVVAIFVSGQIRHMFFKRHRHSDDEDYSDHQTLKTDIIGIAIQIIVYMIFLFFAVHIWGYQLVSLFALLSAVIVSLSLGLQGIISNLATGVIIAASDMYRLGDLVEVGLDVAVKEPGLNGHLIGRIKSFGLLSTTIRDTNNNTTVLLANETVFSNFITNYSRTRTIRYIFDVIVSSDNKIDRVLNIIRDVVEKHSIVQQSPPPKIWVRSHVADNGIRIAVRISMLPDDYAKEEFGKIQTEVLRALQDGNVLLREINSHEAKWRMQQPDNGMGKPLAYLNG